MKLSEEKKPGRAHIPRRTEGFRKRALIIALIMALIGFFFLGGVLYFTGILQIF